MKLQNSATASIYGVVLVAPDAVSKRATYAIHTRQGKILHPGAELDTPVFSRDVVPDNGVVVSDPTSKMRRAFGLQTHHRAEIASHPDADSFFGVPRRSIPASRPGTSRTRIVQGLNGPCASLILTEGLVPAVKDGEVQSGTEYLYTARRRE
jgi:hypothetical protein